MSSAPTSVALTFLVKDDETQRAILRTDPVKYLAYRKKIESELNSRFRFILNGSKEQQEAREVRSQAAPS